MSTTQTDTQKHAKRKAKRESQLDIITHFLNLDEDMVSTRCRQLIESRYLLPYLHKTT